MATHIHTATITWGLGGDDFLSGRYARDHDWAFDGGARVAASASPHIIRPPHADPSAVDPEEAFVAALSSCHMLFFLSFAAKAGLVVQSYVDHPEGTLTLDPDGGRLTHLRLRPNAVFHGVQVSRAQLEALHESAHTACFLARSVTCEITWDLGASATATP